jgi:hypothetical protein
VDPWSSGRKKTGVSSAGEGGAVSPTRELVADLDLGVCGIASNDAGARKLLDIEAEPLSQFDPSAHAHRAPTLRQDRKRRWIGVSGNRGVHHPVRLTPGEDNEVLGHLE